MPDIMENLKKRKVTAEHIRLVRKLRVSWLNAEAGAPVINGNKPFGIKRVHESMATILGWKDPAKLSKEQVADLDHMLADIAYDIPQIFLSAAAVRPGKYRLHNTYIDDFPAGKFNINVDGAGDYEFGKATVLDFDFTEEHIKLLKVCAWKYWCVDPKRPYGDMTYFYYDMVDALGLQVERAADGRAIIPPREIKRLDRLHAEMMFAFSVLFQYGVLEPGVYLEVGYNLWQNQIDQSGGALPAIGLSTIPPGSRTAGTIPPGSMTIPPGGNTIAPGSNLRAGTIPPGTIAAGAGVQANNTIPPGTNSAPQAGANGVPSGSGTIPAGANQAAPGSGTIPPGGITIPPGATTISPTDRGVQTSINTSTNLISAQPANALLYAARASYLRQSRQFDAAILDYTKAIELGKSNPLSYMWYEGRGNLYALTGQDQLAINDFTEAMNLQPDYLPVRYARGRSYNVLKRYGDALADFNYILQVQKTWNYEVYYSRGVANLCLGEPKMASEDFRQFLQSDNWQGKTAPYAVLLGYVAYQIAGNLHAASELLSAAEQRLKSLLWPHQIIMYLCDKETIEGVFQEALDLDSLTEAHWFVGAKLIFAQQREQGLQHLKWVVENGNQRLLDYDLAKALLEHLGG